MNISRRRMLEMLGGAGGAVVFGNSLLTGSFSSDAFAQSACNPANNFPGKKFVFYIHCGSWDGMASGLIQPNLAPQLADRYPSGVFSAGRSMSNNPLINDHQIIGSHVFHNYGRVLNKISNHMCIGLGNPGSLGHGEAKTIQQTGSRTFGSNPGWVAGLAQATSPARELFTSVVSFGGGIAAACSAAGSVKKVATLSASDLANYLALAKDPSSIELGKIRDGYSSIAKSLAAKKMGLASPSALFSGSMNASLDSLGKGLSNAEALRSMMENAMSREKINAVIDGSGALDRSAIKSVSNGYTNLQQAFILAGMLIESGNASGMSFDFDNQDFHEGGSYTTTTRSAAQLWAQLVTFWDWVKSKNKQDDVLVIVSHEFSRTAYNQSGNMTLTIPGTEVNSATNMTFADPGKDHQLLHGMIFVNGKVPPSSRIGGLGDGYTPLRSKNFKGELDSTGEGYSSIAMVGSMVQRIWCNEFPNERAVRELWSNYTESQIIRWALS